SPSCPAGPGPGVNTRRLGNLFPLTQARNAPRKRKRQLSVHEHWLQVLRRTDSLFRVEHHHRSDLLADRLKSCRTFRIELLAALLLDLGKGNLRSHPFAIGPMRGHGIK